MNKVILYFVFILFTLTCCEKISNPSLPPITTDGEGTFGYKVNGDIQGQCYSGWSSSLANVYLVADTSFVLHEYCNDNLLVISLYSHSEIMEGTYSLSGELDNMKYGDSNLISYRSNVGGNAELILLKVDKVSKIISGTFSGTLYSDEGDLVEITEGRFDLTY